MFNNSTEGLEQESFAPAANQTAPDIISEEEMDETDIHAMPNRFLKPTGQPKKRGKVSWLILGIFAFAILGGVIVLAIMFLKKQSAPSAIDNPQPSVNQEINGNVNANQNANANINQNAETPNQRDKKRLSNISEVRNALSLYFADNNIYPSSLSTLVSQYLTALPENPAPAGASYDYQLTEDQLNYQLVFKLESGGVIGSVRLGAGEYLATADKIMTKSEFEANQNSNTNLNQNQNTNNGLPPAPSPTPPPTLGQDSDGDQLTDIEENIYQTNSALADTDGDSYTDASEILNFYDPKTDSGRLMDSGLVEVYQNPLFNYSLLYPKAWTTRALTVDKKEIIFTSSVGEFVEIIVQDNPMALSAYNWYLNQDFIPNTQEIKSVIVAGLPAIQTADGLITYLSVGTKVYLISYNIGTNNQMNFSTTYQLFLKSFMFIEPQGNPG